MYKYSVEHGSYYLRDERGEIISMSDEVAVAFSHDGDTLLLNKHGSPDGINAWATKNQVAYLKASVMLYTISGKFPVEDLNILISNTTAIGNFVEKYMPEILTSHLPAPDGTMQFSGYRTEDIAGGGERDLLKVFEYEAVELGNLDMYEHLKSMGITGEAEIRKFLEKTRDEGLTQCVWLERSVEDLLRDYSVFDTDATGYNIDRWTFEPGDYKVIASIPDGVLVAYSRCMVNHMGFYEFDKKDGFENTPGR